MTFFSRMIPELGSSDCKRSVAGDWKVVKDAV